MSHWEGVKLDCRELEQSATATLPSRGVYRDPEKWELLRELRMHTILMLRRMEGEGQAEQFLADTDVARRYSVTKQTVWRWASAVDGNFPRSVKMHGTARWRLSDLLKYEANLKTER